MNSLRKTFLALSLIAVFPATVQAYSWSDVKTMVSGLAQNAATYAVVYGGEALDAAKANPKTAAAIAVGTAGVLGGAGFLAKKYIKRAKPAPVVEGQDAAKPVSAPSRKIADLVKSSGKKGLNASQNLMRVIRARFANLSRNKKAGVVIGGTVVLAGAAWLAKSFFAKAEAPDNSGE